jgi:hypothetical protein
LAEKTGVREGKRWAGVNGALKGWCLLLDLMSKSRLAKLLPRIGFVLVGVMVISEAAVAFRRA